MLTLKVWSWRQAPGPPLRYHHANDASASPWPWKKRKDRAKSKTNMRTSEMTTALVVDSPTPLAPPVVVNPQEQLTYKDVLLTHS